MVSFRDTTDSITMRKLSKSTRDAILTGTVALLSDHEGQVCSGLHAHQTEAFHRGEGWGTIWSSICRPDLRTLLIAPGHPCEVAYEKVDFRLFK